jgi:protein JBTS17
MRIEADDATTANDGQPLSPLHTRGAYVAKISHSGHLLALAINQKYVKDFSLIFLSLSNGAAHSCNLRNFGLSDGARGRHYWLQELDWLYNDLYVAGVTKYGAVFLVSRLGQPQVIHAFGNQIDMGPALYLTIHPLIIVRWG